MSRLEAPHAELLAFAEALSLAALDGERERVFDALPDWLAGQADRSPLVRVAYGFDLDASATALLACLFACALSESVARKLALACAGGGRGVPFWLLCRLIPELRMDVLAAAAPLRRLGLIGLEEGALRVEARVWMRDALLDRLCGATAYEPEVAERISVATYDPGLANEELAHQLKVSLATRGSQGLSPILLAGSLEPATIAASVATLGLTAHTISAACIPEDPAARDRLARHWSRDAALDGCALVVLADDRPDGPLRDFVDRVAGHVVVCGSLSASGFRRSARVLDEPQPSVSRTVDRWRRALGGPRARKLGASIARVAGQFRLDAAEIDLVCARVGGAIDAAVDEGDGLRILWHAAARAARVAPVPGVTVFEPNYQWRDLILAPPIEAVLRRVETHVRHASTVMDQWGFAERMGGRGRGVAALFAGPSGTGKTMAAEVLASSLDLRLMVIDISQLISKFVGETPKNIAACFAEAERCGAAMVWNEGDAVFGARGAVGHATDRHINAEVGDLLQRIEAFRGFTIVTTNLRHAIDPAFLRRFRFVVDFPMPSENERRRLWQRAFPSAAPLDVIDWGALARLPLSGGSIRNVALGSAFLAAEAGCPIDKALIAAELAEELRKQDMPVTAVDWGSS